MHTDIPHASSSSERFRDKEFSQMEQELRCCIKNELDVEQIVEGLRDIAREGRGLGEYYSDAHREAFDDVLGVYTSGRRGTEAYREASDILQAKLLMLRELRNVETASGREAYNPDDDAAYMLRSMAHETNGKVRTAFAARIGAKGGKHRGVREVF